MAAMEEVVVEANWSIDRVYSFRSASRRSESAQVIPITRSPTSEDTNYHVTSAANWGGGELNPQDAWLPITESRNGNTFSATFLLLCSGIGIQALLLPVALATLGWAWGIICLSLAFTWQLYTIWLLVHLHESDSGTRYSRYLDLAMTAFGQKLGKFLALVPVMYLSAGTCVQLIILGGGTIKLFIKTVCNDGANCDAKSLTNVECFLVFMCMAIVVAQFPNLNSIAWVSLIGATTAIAYCTFIWALSIGKGRPNGTSYNPPEMDDEMDRFGGILNALGIIVLVFRGHNVVLEIQMKMFDSNQSPTSEDTNYHVTSAANWGGGELNPQDAWLPITESRNGNTFSANFLLLCSGIGIQALLLPVALATLGWAWGIICLSLAFTWQLYTIWLLVHLHESDSGTRYSRYLDLAMTAFGQKLGKFLALVPVMYLSAGTCVQLIILGGGTIKLFIKTVCNDGANCDAKSLTNVECFLVFMCMAIVVAQFPNLNSIAWVSLIGATTAIAYCTFIWALSIGKGRPNGTSYNPPEMDDEMDRFGGILNALGIIVLVFRGHNVVLEIQGTLPLSPKHQTHKPMWRGVTVSYLIIAMCLYPLAIAGFWAYGNKVPSSNGGLLIAMSKFHQHDTSKVVLGLIYVLVVINCISTFQIYSMIIFDKLETSYTSRKNKACARWLRTTFRLFFGGMTFFAAVTLPFLGSLAPLIGGLTLPLAYAYPCLMWIAIKKPKPKSVMWCINVGLGGLGLVLSALLVIAAAWNLASRGLHANFFKPSSLN